MANSERLLRIRRILPLEPCYERHDRVEFLSVVYAHHQLELFMFTLVLECFKRILSDGITFVS